MRTVVDTNILIQAVFKPDGTVGPIVTRLAAGNYVLIYSAELLVELLEKLKLLASKKGRIIWARLLGLTGHCDIDGMGNMRFEIAEISR
jgi:hypothetical protein